MRDVTMSLAMPFYPVERPWTGEPLLLAAEVDREAYVAALSREALGAAPDYADCRVPAVWVGGGVACHMADAALGRLLRDLRGAYRLEAEDGAPAEVTLTALPGMVSAATLDACRAGHVARLAFEYATSSADEASELGRFMGPEAMAVTTEVLGPANSIDLSFEVWAGIPGQTERSGAATADAVLALGASHVRVRPFALDPASRLARERAAHEEAWRERPRHRLPGEQEREGIASAMAGRLRAAGFSEYLPGEWALPGHESRYLLMRAAGVDGLGFGLGSLTRFDGVLARDTGDLAAYLAHSDDPSVCVVEAGPLEARPTQA